MPEMTDADLARIRDVVQFRERCIKAVVAAYRRLDIAGHEVHAASAFDSMQPLIEARVRTQVATEALMAAHDELAKVAERLEAKGGMHRATATGVRLACFRLIELADEFARRHSGTGTDT